MVPYTGNQKPTAQRPRKNEIAHHTDYYDNPQGEMYKVMNSNLPDSVKSRLYTDLLQRHLSSVGRYNASGEDNGTVDNEVQTDPIQTPFFSPSWQMTTPQDQYKKEPAGSSSVIRRLFESPAKSAPPEQGSSLMENIERINELTRFVEENIGVGTAHKTPTKDVRTTYEPYIMATLEKYGILAGTPRGEKTKFVYQRTEGASFSPKGMPTVKAFIQYLTIPNASAGRNCVQLLQVLRDRVMSPNELERVIINKKAYNAFSSFYKGGSKRKTKRKDNPPAINTSDYDMSIQTGRGLSRPPIKKWIVWR